MTVSRGHFAYSVGDRPCTGLGVEWSNEEFDQAMAGRVAPVLLDDEGTAELARILGGCVETEFDHNGLLRVLAPPESIEDWRVGEAMAEAWLTDHRDCCFPWPDGRDERRHGSSLPGADLVGLHVDTQGDCLAFGEVKTSSQARYPPSTIYGRSGLQQQLRNLRDNASLRDDLFKYLGHRATGSAWINRYQKAGIRYLTNSSDVRLFGVLIRDVKPHEDDVRTPVEYLSRDCPSGTIVELVALYVPIHRLRDIGSSVITTRVEESS